MAFNKRNHKQESEAREYTLKQLSSICDNSPIIFTDGSAINNPGPVGASAICYTEGISSTPIILKQYVSEYSTSYHGELMGLRIATDFLKLLTVSNHSFKEAHVFTDCRSVIASVSSTDIHNTHQDLIDKIHCDITTLKEKDVTIRVHWVAGHANLQPNELADQAAKLAARSAEDDTVSISTSYNTVKGNIRRYVTNKWQKSWNMTSKHTGPHVYSLYPKVPVLSYKSTHNRKVESRLLRIVTTHTALNEHMHRIGLSESPMCNCGTDRQTVEHVIMKCPLLHDERRELIFGMDYIYAKHNTPIWERNVDFQTLLLPDHTNKVTRIAIRNIWCAFVRKINFSI